MKLILTQIAQLLAALMVLYGLMLAISLLLVPREEVGKGLDSARASSSLFLTEPKYVFMTRSALNTVSDKVILLGASNMLVGFKQAQVQARMGGIQVHNLSVGGANLAEVSQIVDLVREVQTPEARHHNIFAIGLWYGLFTDDKARWYTPDRHPGETDIDIERYRYGFYRRTANGAVPVLPPQQLDLGVLLVHPYLVLDRGARDLVRSLRGRFTAGQSAITDAQRDAVVLGEDERRRYLAFWRDYTGGADKVSDESLRTFDRMIDGILAEGAGVVLVDLPIPTWHVQGSVLAADYRRRIDERLASLRTRLGVMVLTMDKAANDDDFSDEVHPKPRVTGLWAERLASALNAVGPGSSSQRVPTLTLRSPP